MVGNYYMSNSILIIDFGSQVTQLIARRIRELGVFCEVKNSNIDLNQIKQIAPRAIIFSGGPASVYEKNAPTIDKKIFDLSLPILGICYGQQLICHLLGGHVGKTGNREFGYAILNISSSKFFAGVKNKQVWMSHGDKVEKIPAGFKVIAKTSSAPFAAIADEQNKIYGVQFHPEVMHSLDGKKMIKNFVINIAGCKPNWSMKNFKKDEISEIRKVVGKKRVICGLSGGVDSSVVSALINEAIGKQLTCIFVDHGLLRKNEGREVKEVFAKKFHTNLVYVDASKLFLSRLKGITDPEKKRKIIGKTFIEVFDQEAAKIKNAEFLAQGTLYPDVIESSHPNKGASHTIKSHHNVGGLPKKMKLKLLEPVRMLFKDEVRLLGKELGLPYSIVQRHPFPGPGLAIRIIGEITPDKIKILQEADAIYIEEIRKAGLYQKIWQAFSVLLPVKTVGVMGDGRTYENVLALRAVTSVDGMTADVYRFDPEFLCRITNRIINEIKGINRVVYDFTSKPPGTIEWE
ncbi:MAG: glutamine-hydrolyzing GMP synthase [Alphaproteobacteria bacterium RIFCSPLOWO2_01_FULL_40_26]|nr:MAG: glutamine-hydrolyzing GMP synthase [Alphaproteobacteria bacterium RIFCSPHIGHO2_02_FULL_40_34]OFW86474.1 MAG: glutamine-hydrolyzing GMP synthase [Alphaproteobacteria bacterium RIFCSPHIGHO2_01_FULL_40_8]OFW95318.1 MAG: glutamine-hydrolyzing GMP synthase [Alphaproteobacteria bacterium RIFCSPLOWO2_01_FULL_40_26]OFX09221.1 MAG: glutamine-hydrolyzing GMP synthase [Alphaproteobacteria bacterium RIFCSPLOWO2_02_FULL_40_19]OFX11576.1 MAG: glutamine-hydrolyzing GMP synthase [Alphaproteobacteria ba